MIAFIGGMLLVSRSDPFSSYRCKMARRKITLAKARSRLVHEAKVSHVACWCLTLFDAQWYATLRRAFISRGFVHVFNSGMETMAFNVDI